MDCFLKAGLLIIGMITSQYITAHSIEKNEIEVIKTQTSNSTEKKQTSPNLKNTDLQWSGKEYQKHALLQQELAEWMVNHLSPERANNILDIGCGTAILLNAFQKKFPNATSYWGVDPNESMLKQAASTLTIQPEHTLFVRETAKNFSINQTFDLIISSLTFHWIPREDQLSSLTNLWNHMTPGGTLAIVTAADKTHVPFGKALKDVMSTSPFKEALTDFKPESYYFTLSDYHQWLKGAGFEIIRLEIIEPVSWYPNKQALTDFIRSFLRQGKYIQQVRPELYEEFMVKLVNGMINHIKNEYPESIRTEFNINETPLPFHNPSIVIQARKPLADRNTPDS